MSECDCVCVRVCVRAMSLCICAAFQEAKRHLVHASAFNSTHSPRNFCSKLCLLTWTRQNSPYKSFTCEEGQRRSPFQRRRIGALLVWPRVWVERRKREMRALTTTKGGELNRRRSLSTRTMYVFRGSIFCPASPRHGWCQHLLVQRLPL